MQHGIDMTPRVRAASAPAQRVAADATPIVDIMTRHPVVVRGDLLIEDLVALFIEQDISQAPVVDAAERPIGIVTKTDLVIDQYLRGTHVQEHGGYVCDVMTPVPFSLPAAISIGAAARRMLADNVRAVPVVADNGRIIGILSATDVLAWVAGLS